MWTDEQIEYLKQNYGKLFYKDMSEYLKKPIYHIMKKIDELGIRYSKGKNPTGVMKNVRRLKADDHFFKIPNILNCYWAGFIAADGSIRHIKNRKELSIQISLKDVEHLEKFVEQIKFDGSLTKYTRSNGISMCSIHINSNEICEDLEKNFNIVPKKTFIYKPPENLSDEYKDAFIAGYIDGDGCIRKFKTKYNTYYSIDTRGTTEINKFIKERFLEISKDGSFGNRFKCGSINYEDVTKNHCRYKISGALCDMILKKYRLYDIPLLKRKWFKEEETNEKIIN